ncbi:MAG: ClpP family protease [Lachnospiraceae bacterium]
MGKNSKEEKNEKGKKDLKEEKEQKAGVESLSKIHLLTIIGEIEGHELASSTSKTTKYEHVIPALAQIEDDKSIEGLLVLINTIGGDVESGLAIAEMIASLSKPTVSLVLGGSHSIGVPLAVSTDYSFIVPTGTMLIHPVRMSGMVIGAPQTYEYFQRMQDRIAGFIEEHSHATKESIEEMMFDTGYMTKDLGTILVGQEAVDAGIISEVGGIKEALRKLYRMIGRTSGKN